LQINNYELTTLQITSAHMQVHKFASLQIYKVKKSTNYKLIIINSQLNKLHVHICKYAKSPNYQITKYKITKLQIACAHL
jgi:hypothetical protein